MPRKRLPILLSQKLMFNRSVAQILAWKLNLLVEENQSTWRKTFGVRLKSTNLSPQAKPTTRSRVVEVGSTMPNWLPYMSWNRRLEQLTMSSAHLRFEILIWSKYVYCAQTGQWPVNQNGKRWALTLQFYHHQWNLQINLRYRWQPLGVKCITSEI